MSVDLAALKTELALPAYSGMDAHQKLAAINAPGSATAAVRRASIRSFDLVGALDTDAAAFLNPLDPSFIGQAKYGLWKDLMVAGVNPIPITDQLGTLLDFIIPNGATWNNIVALRDKPATIATRAEQLFGHGVVPTLSQVKQAEALP